MATQLLWFVCIEHVDCKTQMTYEEYLNDDSPHVWICIGS